jgi:hypothetical protein
MNKPDKITSKERVARRRAALRAQGLRPKQFWVYDTRVPGFWERVNAQARAIAASPQDKEDQAWIDSLIEWDELAPLDPE